MEDVETNEELNIDTGIENIEDIEDNSNDLDLQENSTSITVYKEVEDPCVSLTIIGENRLTNAEIFVRRGLKYSIKAFFSTVILTIMNMFI